MNQSKWFALVKKKESGEVFLLEEENQKGLKKILSEEPAQHFTLLKVIKGRDIPFRVQTAFAFDQAKPEMETLA